MATGSQMRVSDAEREAAAAELREHFASGRLTQDELDERLDAAFAARTRGDLEALFTDLPRPGPGPEAGPGPGPEAGANSFGPPGASAGQWRPGRTVGAIAIAFAALFFLVPALMLFSTALFGISVGRPFVIVALIAILALLRRLFGAIFGWRGPGRGPRRRRHW